MKPQKPIQGSSLVALKHPYRLNNHIYQIKINEGSLLKQPWPGFPRQHENNSGGHKQGRSWHAPRPSQHPTRTVKQHVAKIPDSLRGSSVRIGTIQRRLAWPLRKDDTHRSRNENSETACHESPTYIYAPLSTQFAAPGALCHDIVLPPRIKATHRGYFGTLELPSRRAAYPAILQDVTPAV